MPGLCFLSLATIFLALPILLCGQLLTNGLDLALQLDAHGVELARGDSEADKIIGLEPVRICALLQVPTEEQES